MSHRFAIPIDAHHRRARFGARSALGSNRRHGAWLGLAVALPVLLGSAPPVAARTEAEAVIHEACGDDPDAACVAELRKVCHRKMTMRCYFSRKERIDVKRADRADEDDVVDAFGKVGTDYDE